jgi:hypothetical protein
VKSLRILVLAGLVGIAVQATAADYYKLPDIKRMDTDLYRSADVIIETRLCHHVPTGEQAYLKYAGPGDYEVIWADHSTCNVRTVVEVTDRSNMRFAMLSRPAVPRH